MSGWGPNHVVVQDEFSVATSGDEIMRMLEAWIAETPGAVNIEPLSGALRLIRHSCRALDSGLSDLAVLGCRAAIESAGYVMLTRRRHGPRGSVRALPLDLAGRVRRVDLAEIIAGLRNVGLEPEVAAAAATVEFHGNAVAHEESRYDRTVDGIQRELFPDGARPKSKKDSYFLVPIHTPTVGAATEDARTAARILAKIFRAMASRPRRGFRVVSTSRHRVSGASHGRVRSAPTTTRATTH